MAARPGGGRAWQNWAGRRRIAAYRDGGGTPNRAREGLLRQEVRVSSVKPETFVICVLPPAWRRPALSWAGGGRLVQSGACRSWRRQRIFLPAPAAAER